MGIDGVPLLNGMLGNYQLVVDYTYSNDYNGEAEFIGRIFHINEGNHKLVFRVQSKDSLTAAVTTAEKLLKLPRDNKDNEIKWMK